MAPAGFNAIAAVLCERLPEIQINKGNAFNLAG
jgi:hypothetical protein